MPTRDPAPRPVLLLDAHTTQALACARSLGRSGRRVLAASRRRWPLAAWSKWSAGQFRVAAETIDEYRRLRDWARERGATVVLPMTERSCLLCNAERGAWEAAGMAVGCAPDATLLRAFDKVRTLEDAHRCGITTPPTVAPTSHEEYYEAAQVLGFPCVVKSRFSDAWVGQSFVRGGGAS